MKNSMFPVYGDDVLARHAGHSRPRARDASARRGGVLAAGGSTTSSSAYGSIPVPLVARMMTPMGAHCVTTRSRDGLRSATRCASRGGAVRDGHGRRRRRTTCSIVGYDREPDTMNRYATHILEDIQSCVVEGLVTTDEKMNIVPVLAAEIPTLENGGVELRPDGGMDVTWKLRPGVKWHDGQPHTSADVKFTVDAINKGDWKPESTDGFDRIASVDTPDSLTAIVHYKEIYAPYQMQFFRGTLPKHVLEGRDIDKANDYNRNPLGTGPVSHRRVEDGRVRAAREGAGLLARRGVSEDRAAFSSGSCRTRRRASTSCKAGEVHVVALVPVGQGARAQRRSRPFGSIRCSATATST